MNLGFLISAVMSFCVAFGNIKNALYRRDPSVDDVLPGSSTVILLSFTGVDLWVCAYRCDRDLVCEGFLYKTEQQQCSLMRCSLQGLDKDPTPGWLYYSYTNACEMGWIEFSGHCYFYNQSRSKWDDAKADCDRKTSYLIEIGDQDENDWIKEKFLPAGGSLWSGGRDDVTEGVFLWQQFQTAMSFTNWVPGEPNNGVHAQCLEIRNHGKWSDAYCTDKYSFLCEKSI